MTMKTKLGSNPSKSLESEPFKSKKFLIIFFAKKSLRDVNFELIGGAMWVCWF